MENENMVMEQENQEYNNTYEQPNYPVEVESTYSPHQQDNDVSIGAAEVAVGGFAIAGVAAVGYGIYKGIKAIINKIRGDQDDEEEEEEEPKKKVKKTVKKSKKKAPAKKRKPAPEPVEDDYDDVEEDDPEEEEEE